MTSAETFLTEVRAAMTKRRWVARALRQQGPAPRPFHARAQVGRKISPEVVMEFDAASKGKKACPSG